MKLLKIFSSLVLLFCLVIPAIAQDMSRYGSRLEITIPYDMDTLLRNFQATGSKEDNIMWHKWSAVEHYNRSPIWSPDGKWIVFLAGKRIWIVSADGGVPTVLYEDYQHETEHFRYYNYLNEICFTPNGQEVTFAKLHFDEEKGSVVTMTETKNREIENAWEGSANFENQLHSIESINIYTGEHRVIAEGRRPVWSHDGRYICYINSDYRKYLDELLADHDEALTILDTVTGEKWFLTETPQFDGTQYVDGTQLAQTYFFTPDDSAINIKAVTVWSDKDNTYQDFQVPLAGGDRRPYEIVSNSPDGQWYLYTDINRSESFSYSGSYLTEDGQSGGYYGKMGWTYNIGLYNLEQGITFELFPEPQESNIVGQYGCFSPDASKICYEMSDYNNRDTRGPYIYIMDVNLEYFQKIVMVEEEAPESFVLLGNYPNPFNPRTTIEFALPESGFAELSIYNISGQKVRELVSEDMTPGVHSVVWDGRDENGTPVSSGVFISRLKTRDNVFSNRMMLVK